MNNCYSQNEEIIYEHSCSLGVIISKKHLQFDLGDATAIGIYLRNARVNIKYFIVRINFRYS